MAARGQHGPVGVGEHTPAIDLRDDGTARPRRAVPLRARPLPPEQPTVLVVDDDAAVRDWLRLSLALEGWEVLDAADGPAALTCCEDVEPDVVVLDQHLPGMSGTDCAAELRNRRVGSVLLVFSAAVDATSAETAQALGLVPISKIERGLLFQLMQRLRDDAYRRRRELRVERAHRP